MEPSSLRSLLDRLEGPPCSCRVKPMRLCWQDGGRGCREWNRPLCVSDSHPGGCERFQVLGMCRHPKTETCDCPMTYGKPCRHVLQAAKNWPIDKKTWRPLSLAGWARLQRLDNPAPYHPELNENGYVKPAPPGEPAEALERNATVTAKEFRVHRGLHHAHPGDLEPGDVDKLGRGTAMTGNGRPRDAGITVMRTRFERRPGPIWEDAETLVMMAHVERVLNRREPEPMEQAA